ncbi:hypothetical protein F750_3572 [Streptomyces sp. PAMC 26508]|nr:hypothetical protein F750_3572 [Streptomyces sp. PAMC 26508]
MAEAVSRRNPRRRLPVDGRRKGPRRHATLARHVTGAACPGALLSLPDALPRLRPAVSEGLQARSPTPADGSRDRSIHVECSNTGL